MKKTFIFILFALILYQAHAVEVTVPGFEIISVGSVKDYEFGLLSVVSADLDITGGYKYGLSLGFSFNFDSAASKNSLNFRMAKATVRDLFSLPLEFNYFLGEGDNFCSGDEFSVRFDAAPFGTEYKGLLYFPRGIGGDVSRRYYGVYSASGTGFSLAFGRSDVFVPMVYAYLTDPEPGEKALYSGDLRFLINNEKIHLEAFGGVSYKESLWIRGGVLAHFGGGKDAEFLFQGGISGWNLDQELTIDNFFFLMEPRFRFGIFGVTGTLFFHPVIYQNIETLSEQGKADINLRFFAGFRESEVKTGVEANMGLNIKKMDDFSLYAAPFISFMNSGVRWDAKVRLNLLGFDNPAEMFEVCIGISTSF